MKKTQIIILLTIVIIAYLIYAYVLKKGTEEIEVRYGYITGCTDATAVNYDPNATQDSGNCLYVGCNDASANNYNPCDPADPTCYNLASACNYIQGTTGCCDVNSSDYDSTCAADTDCICDNAMCTDQVPNQIWSACCIEGYDGYNSACENDPQCSCANNTECSLPSGFVTCYSNCMGENNNHVQSIVASACGQGYATAFPYDAMPDCSGGAAARVV